MNPVYGVLFRLKNTGESSEKFGACECCDKHVNSVFTLSISRRFVRRGDKVEKVALSIPGVPSIVFGHKQCLSDFTNQYRFMQIEGGTQ